MVLDQTEELPPSRFESARAADVLWRVPTTALAPGPYLLRISVTRGETTVTRDVVFRRD